MSDPMEEMHEEEVVDELVEKYEVSKENAAELVKLFTNERSDETALKIKEQCILRYVPPNLIFVTVSSLIFN